MTPRSSVFASLSDPPFRRYAAGMVGSNVGTWMQRVAQAWLVLEMTGSPAMLGLATSLQFAPMPFLAPWAGSLADRVDRRTLLIVTQVALAVQAAILSVIVLTDSATTALVLAFALVLGLITAIDGPARQSFVADLVPQERLTNAVALNATSFNAAKLVGPAVAGFVVALWGTGIVFAINAITFGFMILALASIRVAMADRSSRGPSTVREGLRFVAQRRDLLAVLAAVGVVALFTLHYQVTLAIMVSEQFHAGPEAYGIVSSVMAVGSVAGALLSARRNRTSVRLVFLFAAAVTVFTATAALMPNVVAFGAATTVAGAAILSMLTSANAYLQTRSDTAHRSRVMALYLAVFFGSIPVGAPAVGWIAEQWGPRAALVVPGSVALAVLVAVAVAYLASTGNLRTTVRGVDAGGSNRLRTACGRQVGCGWGPRS